VSVQFKIDWEKALAALVYLAAKGLPDFDKYKVSKMLFLADKYHIVRFARPITGDIYYAVDYGPIPSQVLDRLEAFEKGNDKQLAGLLELDAKFANPRFAPKSARDYSALSQSDIIALDRVVELFGRKSFAELKNLTHAMPAYSKAWENRPEGKKRALMSYEDFFEEEPDAIQGALEEMVEEDAIRKAFPERVL
jgi:hypothetical protein